MPAVADKTTRLFSTFGLEDCPDGHLRIPPNDRTKTAIDMYINRSLIPDESCLERLLLLASLEQAAEPIVALPDIYLKQKNFIPTGIAIALEGALSPMLVSPPNDGFTIGSTGLDESDMSNERLDKVFAGIMQRIDVFRRAEKIIEEKYLWPILQKGIDAVYQKWGFSENDVLRFTSNGNAFADRDTPSKQEILDAFPAPDARPPLLPDFVPWHNPITAAEHCLGVLDGGSHFIELNVVDEIFSPDTAEILSLHKGQVLAAVHNGSADLGLIAHRNYLPPSQETIETFPEKSQKAERFRTAYRAGANFAYANRLYIMAQIRQSLHSVFPAASKLSIISDVPHDMLEQIEHNGRRLYLHRKGASRALPADSFPKNHPFSKTALPFYFPAALGEDSFIMSNPSGNPKTFFTCSHGTGRRMKLNEAIAAFDKDQIIKQIKQKNVRLYRFGRTNFAAQAPAAYKNMDAVFELLKAFNLAQPIVRLRPIATLKA